MKKTIFPFILFSVLVLSFCTTAKKVAGVKGNEEPMTSYNTDISPILQAHCAPCHFPGGGRQRFLDRYDVVSANIDEILYRVELPVDSIKFMPFKSKKLPLSDSLIQVITLWKAQHMPK